MEFFLLPTSETCYQEPLCTLSQWRANLSFHLLLFFLASQIFTFLLKIILRDVFKIISKNASVPYMGNVVKQRKIDLKNQINVFFKTVVGEESQGCIWLWKQGDAQVSTYHQCLVIVTLPVLGTSYQIGQAARGWSSCSCHTGKVRETEIMTVHICLVALAP